MGTVPADQFRARLRHARAYLAAARWEDWGQAPLEALADGALLATVPSGGPYEGLRLARRLDPSLVAAEIDAAALAPAIRAAFEMPDDRVRTYRHNAADLTAPIPLGGGAENGDRRSTTRIVKGSDPLTRPLLRGQTPLRVVEGSQDRALPGLSVGLRRVAGGYRQASCGQALA